MPVGKMLQQILERENAKLFFKQVCPLRPAPLRYSMGLLNISAIDVVVIV